MSRWQEPHLRGVAILCAVCTAAVLVLHARVAPFRQVENHVGDLVIQYSRLAKPDPRLVYIALDDATMNVAGTLFPEDLAASPALQKMAAGWPWPRDVYAMLIDRLMRAGAKVVALDILFPSAREGDPALRAILDQYRGRVVIGSNFADEPTPGSPRSYSLPSPDLVPGGAADDRIGFVNFWPDADGVIRTVRYRLTQSEALQTAAGSGPVYYSFAARVLQKAGFASSAPGAARGLRFAPAEGPGGFQPIPLYTLFLADAWKANFRSGALFKDKIVVVGPFGNSLKDQLPTPFGLMDGATLHLNAINDALHGDFLSAPSETETDLLIAAMGFAAFGLTAFLHRPMLLGVSLMGATLGFLGIAIAGIDLFHRVMPLLSPLLAFDAGSLLAFNWKWLLERRERARMRRIFERFVSKNVVKEVVENPSSYLHQLGGVRKSVAILMTDLRNFTSLTEESDSHQLVAHLNEYFTEMVKCIFASNGTVDKFVGDAILAVWGNIHSDGHASDATLAVQTALRMLASLDELNKDWAPRGWPVLKMGIGINFGEVIFGAIGSEQKAEPTVIGDAVNSASRLEGLTKQYGVDLLVGETVAELVRGAFHLQLVDFVRMKGKARAMKVYSVLSPGSEPLDAAMTAYLEKYEAALACYERGDFETACPLFEEALAIKPGDAVAGVYLGRCRQLTDQRPETWDGVFVMKSK